MPSIYTPDNSISKVVKNSVLPNTSTIIIGENSEFKSALQELDDYAKEDALKVVSLYGDTGTGKELFAERFHLQSKRAKMPFVKVNCTCMSDNLLESELFGHKKGAFTGATSDTKGKFLLANGGTIFLDEMGKSTKPLQEKLLRVIEDGIVVRVGSEQPERTNVRILLGFNIHPDCLLKSGDVIPDFMFRINGFPIQIPSLRERRDDIPLLVEFFIKKFNESYGRSIRGVTNCVMSRLIQYEWPGNVRELQHTIERLVIKAKGKDELDELPASFQDRVPSPTIIDESALTNEEFTTFASIDQEADKKKKSLIESCLHRFSYNISDTAKSLDVPRSTLYALCERLEIQLSKI